jgi:cephalosporin hydroxylase
MVPSTMSLAERYRELCETESDIHEHLPTFVELVKRLNAAHVIELGTRTGVSTIAWLHGLDATGGRLTSVDIDERPDIGEHERWTFVRGDDCDPAVYGTLEPADIVFLDTSHRYDHTLRELNLYRWLVRPGGVIVCHDTMLEHPIDAPVKPRYPVRSAIEEFCTAEGFAWHNRPNCWGLGIIEIR